MFSSTEAGFVSEPHAGHQARATVRRALAERTPALPITWILDSGCDDVAVWRTLGEQDAHLRCRLCPDDRRIPYLAPQGGWAEGSSAAAGRAAPLVATTPTMREVRTTGQPRAKRQAVTVIIHACPLQLTYATHVRRTGSGTTVTRPVGLVEIRLADTALEPWLLRTDWAVATAAQAPRIFQL